MKLPSNEKFMMCPYPQLFTRYGTMYLLFPEVKVAMIDTCFEWIPDIKAATRHGKGLLQSLQRVARAVDWEYLRPGEAFGRRLMAMNLLL